jgi:hypothetical protein
MAITTTELEVYSGNAVGTLVGTKITKSGSPSSINLNQTELGVALQPGHQYCCRARVYNTDLVWSDWTTINSASTFITLILAEFYSEGGSVFEGGCGKLAPAIRCTKDANVIQVSDVGVYLSTNASGTNAIKVSAGDEQHAGQGFEITAIGGNPLAENTTYYAVPYVVDSLGREYVGDWANDGESANSGYRPPVISMSNKVTTVNSLSASLNVTSSTTINHIKVYVRAAGQSTYQPFSLTAQTGLQNFTITNGDTDDNGNTITIVDSTEYQVYVTAANRGAAAQGGGYEDDCPSRYPLSNATPNYEAFITQAAVAGYVRIDSISSIGPTSAVCNLSYNENASPTPSQNE